MVTLIIVFLWLHILLNIFFIILSYYFILITLPYSIFIIFIYFYLLITTIILFVLAIITTITLILSIKKQKRPNSYLALGVLNIIFTNIISGILLLTLEEKHFKTKIEIKYCKYCGNKLNIKDNYCSNCNNFIENH